MKPKFRKFTNMYEHADYYSMLTNFNKYIYEKSQENITAGCYFDTGDNFPALQRSQKSLKEIHKQMKKRGFDLTPRQPV